VTNTISGGFGITKAGNGTLILSGSNSYTGNTTVSAGVLNVQNANALGTTAGGTSVTSGAALQLQGGITVTGETLTLNGGGVNSDGALRNISGNNTWAGNINSTGATTHIGSDSGLLTLSGNLSNTNSTWPYTFTGSGNILVSGNMSGTSTSAVSKLGTGTLMLSGNNTFSGNLSASVGTVSISSIGNVGVASAAGAGTTINIGGTASSGTLLYTGPAATSNKTINLAAGDARTATITQNGTGLLKFTSNFTATVGGNKTLVLNGSGLGEIAGAIVNNTGNLTSLTKNGNGTWTLSGNNTYSGATAVSAGVLNIQHANGLGDTTNGTALSSGAALQLQGGITISAEALSLTGNGVSTDGALRNIFGSNTYGGAITLAGATRINSDADLLTLSGGISGAQNLTIGGAGNTTISSAIATSTGTLTKDGAGTLVLSANNTYTGATAVGTSGGANAGTLQLSGLGKISTAATSIFGGTLDLNGTNQSITTLSLGGGASGSTAAVTTGSGTLTLGGNVDFSATNNANGASISGNLDLGAAPRTFTIGDSSAAASDLTISAAISNGNLTKSGAGTLTLSGVNTYSGTTTISAGNLTLTGGSAISDSGAVTLTNAAGAVLHVAQSETIGQLSGGGSNGGDISIAAGQSLTLNLAAGGFFAGSISGSGGLIRTGFASNVYTLSGTNTYSGGTTIKQGYIVLGADNAIGTGNLTFDTTGTSYLRLSGRNQTITGLSMSGASNSSIIENLAAGNSVLTVNLADGVTSSSNSFLIFRDGGTGTLALVKTGNGTLDFSTYASSGMNYSGGLTVNGGNFSYSNTAALGNSTAGGAITLGGGTLNYTGSSSVTIANNATLSAATTSTLNNAAGNVTVSGTIGGTGSLTKSGAGNLTLSTANTYQGATNINAGTLQIGNAAALGAGGTISFGGGTLQYGAGITDDLSSRFSTAANQAYSIDTGANNIAFASALSSSGGTLAKSGAGNLTLTVANSYTGATTVSAGVLNIQNANALGTTDGGTTVSSGAALQLQGGITIGAEALSLTGTGVSTDGALRNISGSNTYGGAITLAGASRINSDADLLTFSGGISGAQNLTIGGAGNTTISGAIATSTGTLTKDGAGTLILSANNTYSGATAVGTSGGANAGTLQLSGVGKISTAATTLFGGTLDLNGINQSITTLSLGGGASGSTAAVTTGSGTLALGGTVTFSAANNANGASISGNLDLGGATRTFTIGDSSAAVADLTVSAAISNGPLTKNGAGTLVLSGINTYTGTTTVSAGNLTVSSGSAISDSGSVTLTNAAGAILYVAQSETIGNLSGGGASGGDISIASGQTLTANQSSATTFAGIISGSGGFAKNGTGTLTLSSTNTYQGATTINAGAVALTGSNTASATTINSGGTLIGTGSAGAVTVNSGGFIGAGSAAATPGTLTVGSLTLNGGSGYTWDFGNVSGTPGTNWDLVTAASTTINADSSNKFTIFITGNPTGWSPTTNYASGWNILQWGTLNSAFDANAFSVNAANFTGSAPTGAWTFQNLGGYLNLSYNAPVAAAVWTAGSGTWSTAANWQENAVPSNNSPLEFSGAGGVSTNNGALTTIGGITFTSNASGSYTLNGTALDIVGGISNLSNSTQTVAIDTTMTAAQSINAGSANLTISGAVNNGGATLTSAGNNTVSISGAISGAGRLTKNGTGSLILSGSNSYIGNTTVSAGVLNIQNNNALGTTAGGTSITSGAALQLQGGITITGEALTIDGGGASNTGALRNFSGDNTWTGNINSSGATAYIGSDSGLLTLSGNISNTNPSWPITFSGSGNILVSGNISGTGSSTVAKRGTGTLTLSGNNTFTGTLAATEGTVSISSIGNVGQASAAGAGSTINIGATALNGILLYTGSAATSNKTINLSTGSATFSSTITQNGTGLLKFTSDFTATIGGNKTLILNGSGLGEIAGAIVNNTGNLTSLTKNGDGTWTLSGNNTYSGATTISAGTLQFAKTASLYNGTTASWTAPNIIVNSGGTLALNVGGAGEFTSANVDTIDSLGGASNGFRNNSTLALDTTNAGGTFTHSGNISNTNSGSNVLNLAKLGTGTLALTGNNTYTGATTITAGTLQISSAGRLGGGSYSGNISNSGTFIYAGTNNQTLSGVISGSGALTQNGTGTLILTGNNIYTGNTTISSGTLTAAAAGALPTSTLSAVTINGSSTLALGASQSVASLSGTSGSSVNLNANTLTINGSATTTYSGGISGTGNLVKNGSGTQTLAGATTFNGTTTVNSGILQAATANALANTSQVVLNNGGSFLVTADDAIGTNTGIELNGGTLAFGAAGYDGHVGALTLSANSTIDLGTSSNGVLLRFTNINWNNPNALLSIYNWTGNTEYSGNPGGGLDQVVIGNATTTALSASQLQQIHFYSGIEQSSFIANAFQITSGTYNREIIAVPETETCFYAVALLAGVVVQYLRRRAKRKPLEGHRPA
jgi:autotransporter-associated beta strand protein